MDTITVRERLEYLRSQIQAERISYGEIAELQGLAAAGEIDPGDAELLEWAGVPEWAYATGDYRTAKPVFPLPGDTTYDHTVIASVWLTEEPPTALVLLLAPDYMRDPAFRSRYNYAVAELDLRPRGNLTILSTHENIVPAVREYEQNGGDY